MDNLIMPVIDFVKSVPIKIWIASAGLLTLLIVILIVLVKRSRLMKSALRKLILSLFQI